MSDMSPERLGESPLRIVSLVLALVFGVLWLGALAVELFMFGRPSGSPVEDNSFILLLGLTPIVLAIEIVAATFAALAFPARRRTVAFGIAALVVLLTPVAIVAAWMNR
ncbi:hypothetical protein [Microbacterium sp. NPDC058345]|uniref:hypothetical protein n=1 Tax=Microbacterium sp. NPDC058345 TaxID=3346455 RepID=UPI00365D3AD9